jgi:signal transduction histidine kinase
MSGGGSRPSGVRGNEPRTSRWPWVALAFFVAIAMTALILVVANEESLAEQIPFVVAFSMFGVVGALILSRQAGNRIGGLLLWGACATAVGFLGGELVTYLVSIGTTTGPAVVTAGILSDSGWLLGIFPVLIFIPLLFPDGRLPSPRWRVFAWISLGFIALLFVGFIFGEAELTGSSEGVQVRNPLALPFLAEIHIPDVVVTFGLLGTLIGSVVSLVLRFRRAASLERQQIKWVALALSFVLFSFVFSEILRAFGVESTLLDTIVTAPAFLSIPVAIGISVLQYRLYELDVVVKKALVAGTLALIVILVYGAVVGAFGLFAVGEASSGWMFVIALALGLAFRPVSRFARRLADRLVYGRRATPYEVLTEFSERVGEAFATEDVLVRMAQILAQGTGAASASVWLRVGRRLRPAATWPADAPEAEELRLSADTLPALAGQTAIEVRDGGQLLGALSVAMPANDPMTPAKERLIQDLASQAGLVLRNVRLVEELRASQRRIVAAQDTERRRIERNIHDGAQQQLVALTVKMRLAQSLAGRDADKTQAMLEQMQEETQAALEDLRDLARGIYPPLLADKGLAAALESQVRKTGLPAELSPDGVTRYAPEVEAAVYFSVLEALQNVAKYAAADRTTVRLEEHDGWLTFEVRDDGRGFDPLSIAQGAGLQNIADRLAALEGSLDVRSHPGEGTVVSGRIPVASEGPA